MANSACKEWTMATLVPIPIELPLLYWMVFLALSKPDLCRSMSLHIDSSWVIKLVCMLIPSFLSFRCPHFGSLKWLRYFTQQQLLSNKSFPQEFFHSLCSAMWVLSWAFSQATNPSPSSSCLFRLRQLLSEYKALSTGCLADIRAAWWEGTSPLGLGHMIRISGPSGLVVSILADKFQLFQA